MSSLHSVLSRWIFAIGLLLAPIASMAEDENENEDTYDEATVMEEAEDFFGGGAEGLAKVVEKAFKEHGRPNGFIAGEEASGAIGVGIRYGKGRLKLKNGASRNVFWQGPSIGFDFGANADKVFILVYNLDSPDALFERFPGVDGSLYFVAGVGLHYVQSDDKVLAPIHFGVGWRQGLSVGYMHFTRKKSWVPF